MRVKLPALSFLPPELRKHVRIEANGEVVWPLDEAASAINALADSGRVVLGLDVRGGSDGGTPETPWSVFEPDERQAHAENVEAGRQAALEALPGAREHGDWVLVTWTDPVMPEFR